MSHSLVDILSQHYMWPWIQEFAVGLARLSKRAYEVFKDNMHAEAHVVQESRETQHLIDFDLLVYYINIITFFNFKSLIFGT